MQDDVMLSYKCPDVVDKPAWRFIIQCIFMIEVLISLLEMRNDGDYTAASASTPLRILEPLSSYLFSFIVKFAQNMTMPHI